MPQQPLNREGLVRLLVEVGALEPGIDHGGLSLEDLQGLLVEVQAFEHLFGDEIEKDRSRLVQDLSGPPDPDEIDRLLRDGVYIKGKTARRPPKAMCDFCKPAVVPAIADSTIRGTDGWANMCRDHYLKRGTRPGNGSAQILIDGLVKPDEAD
jgi:hypothetical protein